ncbi:MAG TPA: GNAT family N-acetyltransferase [Candidatus Saccharimonadales bacterium]
MSEVTVRQATVDDLPAVQKLATGLMVSHLPYDPLLEKDWYYHAAGKKYVLTSLKGRNHVCFLAEIDGQAVGYLRGSLCNETWLRVKRSELDNLFIADAYRRHGAGNKLLAAFRDWSQQKGAKKIKVVVSALNKEALPFYEMNGFKTRQLEMEAEI